MCKVAVIRDCGSFFSNNTYNPVLPIIPHNSTLIWMPTSSSTVSLYVPALTRFCCLLPYPQPCTSKRHRGRLRSPDAVMMTAASGDAVPAVATNLDAIAVGANAGDQLAKPGRRGQFCNNAARPGGRRGLPARPGCRPDDIGHGGCRRCCCGPRRGRRQSKRRPATRFALGRQRSRGDVTFPRPPRALWTPS